MVATDFIHFILKPYWYKKTNEVLIFWLFVNSWDAKKQSVFSMIYASVRKRVQDRGCHAIQFFLPCRYDIFSHHRKQKRWLYYRVWQQLRTLDIFNINKELHRNICKLRNFFTIIFISFTRLGHFCSYFYNYSNLFSYIFNRIIYF